MMKKSIRLSVQPEQMRLHRFPPLLNLAPGQSLSVGQQEYQQGFQQGFAQGLAEGHEQGQLQGLEQGNQLGYEQGYAQGIAAGRQDGERQGREVFENAIRPFPGLREQLETRVRQQMLEQQQSLVELVAQVARRVIHAELTLHPQQLLHLVQEALNTLQSEPVAVHIYLNPDDRQRLSSLGYSDCAGWPLDSDPALQPGDCRIESQESVVESSIETRLGACVDSVRQVLTTATAGSEHE